MPILTKHLLHLIYVNKEAPMWDQKRTRVAWKCWFCLNTCHIARRMNFSLTIICVSSQTFYFIHYWSWHLLWTYYGHYCTNLAPLHYCYMPNEVNIFLATRLLYYILKFSLEKSKNWGVTHQKICWTTLLPTLHVLHFSNFEGAITHYWWIDWNSTVCLQTPAHSVQSQMLWL